MRLLRWAIVSLACLLVFASVCWLFLGGRNAKHDASPEYARRHGKPIPVRTALVTQSSLDEVVGATAVTEASQTAAIRIGANRLSPSREFKATAVLIKKVHVAEGSFVQQGDMLVELDEVFLQQVVRQREAEFTAATGELEVVKQTTTLNQKIRELEQVSAEANLDFRTDALSNRTRLLDNLQELHGTKAATNLQVQEAKVLLSQAKFDLTEAKDRLQRAQDSVTMGALRDELELQVAAAKFEAAKLALEMTQKDVAACQITSPVSGFVTQINIVPGEIVDTAVELTKVLKLDPIFVRVDFPQERIDELALSQSADVVLDSYPKETFHGTVRRISAQANTQLRVVPVIVELANSTNRIKAGISGFARVHVSKTALLVPATAVIERGGRAMTFCVEGGHARIREIQTGAIVDNGWIEIRSGLDPGSEVVVYDTETLHDDDPVDVEWRRWARRE